MAPPPISADLFDGTDELPHFNPVHDQEPLPPAVRRMRDAIHLADALLFCTPEYAGALPGSFKNLLDWMIGDDHPRAIYRKPVGWINISASGTGAADAYASLRTVLTYAHASIVEAACVSIPVTPQQLADSGYIRDPTIRSKISAALSGLAGQAG